MSTDPLEQPVPPVGEEIHLPGPSLLPLLLTVGITTALVGVTVSPILIVIGVLIIVPVAYKWATSTREEIDHLPPH
jgi:hypothetical protein